MEGVRFYRQLTEVFQAIFDDNSIVLTPDTTSADFPEWDCVAHVQLIVAIEDRLSIKFDSSELESLRNVGQLVGLIEYKLETLMATS